MTRNLLELPRANWRDGPAMTKILTALCGAMVLMALDAGPAAADLELCNKTDSRVGVALGYKDHDGWASEGWWNIGPNDCETLYPGPLIARYYYVFAVDYDKGGSWSGDAILCTRDKLFTIRGIKNCEERGYQKTGFFEVDTGENPKWTVSLSGAQTAEQQSE
jgi:uncharacterized membrane protein